MSIEVTWLDEEQSIMFAEFPHEWTWEDYNHAIDNVVELTVNIQHRFDQIVDLRQTKNMPKGSPYQHVLRGRQSGTASPVVTVYIGLPTTINVFIQVLNRLQKRKIVEPITASNVQQAIEIIKNHRDKS